MANSSSANLRFADYSVLLGSVPAKFDIPPEIILLSNSVVPTHSFRLEQEIVSKANQENAAAKRFEDEKLARERKERQEKEASEQKISQQNESPLLDLDFGGEVPSVTVNANPDATSGKSTPAPAPAVAPSAEPTNDSKLQMMIERTKQPQDVCFFYLECADWNLDNAVDLLNSMQAISN